MWFIQGGIPTSPGSLPPSEFYQWSLSLFSPMSPTGFEPTTSIVTSVGIGCTTRPVSRLPRKRIFSAYILRSATVLTSCGRSPRREKCHAGDKITLGERSSPHASVYRLVTIRESWENRGLSSNPWDYPIRGVISSKLGGLYEREVLAIGRENGVVLSKLGCLYESGISCR